MALRGSFVVGGQRWPPCEAIRPVSHIHTAALPTTSRNMPMPKMARFLSLMVGSNLLGQRMPSHA